MMKLYIYIIFLFITASLNAQGFGSVGVLDPISAGMANTYTTSLTGVYAVGKNPANIILDRGENFEIATVFPFPNVGVFAGTDFISIDEINYFFGGIDNGNGERVARYLNAEDKERLRQLFDRGGVVSGAFTASLFNVVINTGRYSGTFGFSINENIASYADLPESVVDLALDGNPVGYSYEFNGSKINAVWMRDYTLSYARDFRDVFWGFRNFNIGISLRYIQGFALIKSDYIKSSIVTGEEGELITSGDFLGYSAFSKDFNIEYDFDSSFVDNGSSFSTFPSPSGNGFGMDIGLSARVSDKLSFGVALTGIGSIKWNHNVAEFKSDAVLTFDDLTNKDEVDSLFDEVIGDGKFINEITTELPAVLRLGVAFDVHKYFRKGNFPGTLVVAIDYNQGLNYTAIGTTKPRFSIGAEWRPAYVIPIRTGFSFGGRFGFAWSFGTGLDLGLFEFNISAYNFRTLLMANSAEAVSFALGSRWKF
jgi:hypothetical protein